MIVYGVPRIEIEFGWGERPFGWALYKTKIRCVTETKENAQKGNFEGGYLGPVRPLRFHEIPSEGLEEELLERVLANGVAYTESDFWNPKFESKPTYIK